MIGYNASAEERAHGGGCLSLLRHFADWCGSEQTQFTGLWDMGHKLQLVYGDALLTNNQLNQLNKVVFGVW